MTTPDARWRHRPDGSTWGDFGADDELGRLNLITPAKVVEAAAEVREGLSFCLSLPLDMPNGRRGERFAPRLFPTGEDCCNMSRPLGLRFPGATGVTCDDAVELCLQYSTQWDGFSHFGRAFDADGDGVDEVVYYNGWRAGEHIVPVGRPGVASGAHRLGIQTYAEKAIQTRGVMLDLDRHFGPDRKRIGFGELSEALTAQAVTVEPGDILCLHSGIGRAIVESGGGADLSVMRHLGAELDGSDPRLLQWITDSGVAAIAADNFAVEWFQKITDPSEPRPLLPLHEHCLFKLGVPLGELWWLSDLAAALAARGRTRFMLTAPPLRLPRAVGSPVTPVATI
ncbi:MAG: hypothetical protein JWP35_1191 [Caulobacter sp.]|nr:hypothetical protein [Caulobacter sp.]